MTSEPRPAVSYPFEFEPPLDRWARWFGVVPTRSFVAVDDVGFEAIFGPWRVASTWSNVVDVTVTGPYSARRVIGPARLSGSDRGITMAPTTRGGVCLRLREPVPGIEPLGLIRHPGITLGLADVEAFVADVHDRRHRAGQQPADADPPSHPKGRPVASLRAIWNWRQRTVRHYERDVERLNMPTKDRTGDVDDQPVENGTGPTMHRRYRIGVTGSVLEPAEAMARVQADPCLLADPDVAPFVKSSGTSGSMTLGDRYLIQVFGPWTGAVEVIDVDPYSFRLATLEGHMESGVIDMRVDVDDDVMWFTIESWARSHDHFLRLFYDRLRLAFVLQSETWAIALDRFAAITEGSVVGPIEMLTERSPSHR